MAKSGIGFLEGPLLFSGSREEPLKKLVFVYFGSSEITKFCLHALLTCHNFAITGHDSFWPSWAEMTAGEAQTTAGGAEPPATPYFNHSLIGINVQLMPGDCSAGDNVCMLLSLCASQSSH